MTLQTFFHRWERRLASATNDRVVRPFDWGLDWIPQNGHRPDAAAADVVGDWVAQVMDDTDAFFTPAPTTDYTLSPAVDGDLLTFPSAFVTPHPENNTVSCRYFPARVRDGLKTVPYRSVVNQTVPNERNSSSVGDGLEAVPTGGARAAVLVLPQW